MSYEFSIKIAGYTGRVEALFESTPLYLGKYASQNAADFSVTVRPEDLKFEADALYQEALEEGFRVRQFTDPFLERTAIQRAFAEFLFDRDILLTHGSTVAVDGKAYLFTARSGTGKSTHTRLWMQAFGSRAQMVNDDKPFLRLAEDGVTAFGSPWSGKHGLDSNIAAPLQGICLLERGTENQIQSATPELLLPILRKDTYRPLDPEKEPRFLQLTQKLAEAVPLWHMHCNKDLSAAIMAYEAMAMEI